MRPLPYLLFFLSGAAALIYEVVWARSLALVFGGSHLAVTTVLAVFMGGLALGSLLLGRVADRARDPLRVYGWLELGIALSAAAFFGLLHVYPAVYATLAGGHAPGGGFVSIVRFGLAALGMLVPSTLMGGTLPVLARFVDGRASRTGSGLPWLYAANTLGAVAGTLLAGFVLLRGIGTARTQAVAIATNLAVGIAALALARRRGTRAPVDEPALAPTRSAAAAWTRPILWGIAISGFCALGYEVLWTRMLSVVAGTSVYAFAIMLAAFLCGIAAGSQADGAVARLLGTRTHGKAALRVFAVLQLAIAGASLWTTWSLRDLPAHAVRAQRLLLGAAGGELEARQGANAILAFGAMFVPALLLGAAFPLAGRIHAAWRGGIGAAVGEVAAFNTVGALLGAVLAGWAGMSLFGTERSLQLLACANAGAALWIAATTLRGRCAAWLAGGCAAAGLLGLALSPGARMWDPKLFAVYRNNQRAAFLDPERVREALAHTAVLYRHEGVNESISVIRPRGAHQALLVNGRVEASSNPWDVQCQRTLGHLPMLLCRNPRRVFVLGLGTGMTLGSTSVHPEVETLTLAEIEPGVIPAARTFSELNHRVLDDPRLRIVIDDGRSFLLTTPERFDVITADPIHPGSAGAAYLYTLEYYRLVASRLAPGGVACQWLPMYELTAHDLATVVRTWTAAFPEALLWVTHYDAILVGSHAPLRIDPAALERRISVAAVRRDLEEVAMGSARDLLAYFVMGRDGLREFGRGGAVHTDDNLWLEFRAAESVGRAELTAQNLVALTARRESVRPYLEPGALAVERDLAAAPAYDAAHALFLQGRWASAEFAARMTELEAGWPEHAPARFLRAEVAAATASEPRLHDALVVEVAADALRPERELHVGAVVQRIGPERGVVSFVDNAAREIYGERYLDAPANELDERMAEFAGRVLAELAAAYRAEAAAAGGGPPSETALVARIRSVVRSHVSTADVPRPEPPLRPRRSAG